MARCTSATLSAWRSRLSCVTRAPSCSGTSWIHVSRGSERARIACGRVFVSTGMARGGNARALGNARGTHAAATAAESGAALDAGGADAAGSSIADARSEKADGPMKKETCMQSLVIVESPSKVSPPPPGTLPFVCPKTAQERFVWSSTNGTSIVMFGEAFFAWTRCGNVWFWPRRVAGPFASTSRTRITTSVFPVGGSSILAYFINSRSESMRKTRRRT